VRVKIVSLSTQLCLDDNPADERSLSEPNMSNCNAESNDHQQWHIQFGSLEQTTRRQ
jgi:hypothetical protein